MLAGAKALDSCGMSKRAPARQLEELKSAAKPVKIEDEDDDMDLPPLDTDDGADEDGANEDGDFELLSDPREDAGDPLDDANAQDLDVGLDIADDDAAGSSDEGHEDGIDIGALDEDLASLEEERGSDDEASGTTGDDDGLSDLDTDATEDDGGAEGTGENAEDDVDESALPELDESEHDEGDDKLADVLLEEAAAGKLPPWAPSRFVVLEGAGGPMPCAAVAIAGARVLAAGDEVLVVDEGAHAARRTGIDLPSTAIAATDEVTVIGTSRAGLVVSRDGNASTSPLGGFRAGKGSVALASTPGRIWIRHDEALWSMKDRESAPVLAREAKGRVLAITASGGAIIVLASRDEGFTVERLRNDDEAWQMTVLGADVAEQIARDPSPSVAAAQGGRRVAIVAMAGLHLSNDGARTFESIDLRGVVAACFAGDDEDAPLYAIVAAPEEGLLHLVRVTEDGEPSRVAELRGAKDAADVRGASMAWDASRELVWVGTRQGLFALGPARRH